LNRPIPHNQLAAMQDSTTSARSIRSRISETRERGVSAPIPAGRKPTSQGHIQKFFFGGIFPHPALSALPFYFLFASLLVYREVDHKILLGVSSIGVRGISRWKTQFSSIGAKWNASRGCKCYVSVE